MRQSTVHQIHALLADHCTTNRERYLDEVRKILNDAALRSRDDRAWQNHVWQRGWDKPFYQNAPAAVVGPSVNHARNTPLFEDFTRVCHPDFMVTAVERGPIVIDAIARGYLQGQLTANRRLWGVQSFAGRVPAIADALKEFHGKWQQSPPNPELLNDALQIASGVGVKGVNPDLKVFGFGFITACHLLTDLGLPLVKPDIWVCRFVSALPGVPARIRQRWPQAAQLQAFDNNTVPLDFLEHRFAAPNNQAVNAYRMIMQPVVSALIKELEDDSTVKERLNKDRIELPEAFRFARFADWNCVHFGMGAATDIGLQRNPMQVLEDSCQDEFKYLKAMAKLITAVNGQANWNEDVRVAWAAYHEATQDWKLNIAWPDLQ